MSKEELQFGDYVCIERDRFSGDRKHYIYKVIGTLKSNGYVDVPVKTPEIETLHGRCVPVAACICCGVCEREVWRYRIQDVKKCEMKK